MAFELFDVVADCVQQCRKLHACSLIDVAHGLDAAVDADGADGWVEASEDTLSFAECVCEDDAGAAFTCIGTPPRVDVLEDCFLIGPAVDRKAECAFGDECVAADWFEGVAGGIESSAVSGNFVIAGDDADFTCRAVLACGDSFDADLRRTQDVACGVERNADVAHRDDFAEGLGFDFRLRAHT